MESKSVMQLTCSITNIQQAETEHNPFTIDKDEPSLEIASTKNKNQHSEEKHHPFKFKLCL